MQLVLAPEVIDEGLHEMPVSVGRVEAGEIETVVNLLTLFQVADTSTDTVEDTVAPVAANLVVAKPAGTFTVDGTCNTSLLEEESFTTVEVATFWVSVIVQVVEPPDASGLGEQAMLERVDPAEAGEIDSVAVLVTPLQAADTLTEVTVETVPAVELKLADAEPAGMITLTGTGKDAEEDVRFTVALVWVAAERVTVQLVLVPDVIDEGLQEMPESTGVPCAPTLTDPPELASGIASPAEDVPNAPFTPTLTVEPPAKFEASATVTTATTPVGMAVVFMPDARQVYVPVPPEQLSDLPAPDSAGPPAICTEVI